MTESRHAIVTEDNADLTMQLGRDIINHNLVSERYSVTRVVVCI